MSQDCLAALIHEQTAAIAALERRIGTHEAIRRILRVLAETTERTTDPEQQALYQQAMDALRQMQAEELCPRFMPALARPTLRRSEG